MPTQPDPEGGANNPAPEAGGLRSRLKHEASEKGMEAAFFKDSDLLGRMKDEAAKRSRLVITLLLAYQSLGVIYGDIGTSVLYVYPSIFSDIEPGVIDGSGVIDSDVLRIDVCGAMSLIFWTLTLLALIKYIAVVLRANDTGEGGTVALYALICRTMGISPFGVYHKDDHKQMKMMKSAASVGPRRPDLSENRFRNQVKADKRESKKSKKPQHAPWFRPFKWPHSVVVLDGSAIIRGFRKHVFLQRLLLWACIWATGLVIGDGILMPAFSVVSAIQGLQQNTDGLEQADLVGISIGIIILLFLLQHVGTERISFLFSPIIIIWLICNLAVGINNLAIYGGSIFQGLSPHYIVLWFQQRGKGGWEALGGVMLAITGTETMFAAMGHFTQPSIALAFGMLSYPCLIITYLGQGAYLLSHPEDMDTTFWSSVPTPFFWPMLVLATLAAVVASQAVITGTFSIVRQAMSMGIFPRMHIIHTGRKIEGQIFIPVINYTLMILCVVITAAFGGSFAKLGHAYGVAVMMVMVVTTCMVTLIMLVTWEWSLIIAIPWVLGLLFLECGFLSANLFKVPNGGWFTLVVAAVVGLIMGLWWWGQLKRRRVIMAQSKGHVQDVFVVRHGFQRFSTSNQLKANAEVDVASPMAVTSAGYALTSAVKDPNQVSTDSPTKSMLNSANPSQHGAFDQLTPEDVAVLMAAAAQVAPSSVMANTFQRNSSMRDDPQPATTVQAGFRRQISAADAAMPTADPTSPASAPQMAMPPLAALNVEHIQNASSTPPGGVTPTAGSTSGRGPPGLGRLSKMSQGNTVQQRVGSSSGKPGPPALRTDSQNPTLATTSQGGPALGNVSMSKVSASGPSLGRLSASAKAAAKAAMQVFANQQHQTDGQKAAQQALQMVSDLSNTGQAAVVGVPNGLPPLHPSSAPSAHPLSLQSNPTKALARLGGVGIYYSDNPTGIPPVMRHFLRNIDAMHEVVVFLSVRFLPMPSINNSERLLLRAVQGVPNFYQVVARYGYQDVVDHRRPFVAQVVSTIMHRLELKSGLKYMGMEDDFIHEMEGENVVDEEYYGRSTQNLGPLEVVHEDAHENERTSLPLSPGARMSQDSNQRFRSPSLEHPHQRMSLTNMCPESAPVVTKFAMDALERMRLAAGVPNAPQASHDAFRAAQCLTKAANEGVVYYLGRTWTRTHADRNIAYQLVFGNLFRTLELLSYQDSEAWSIPLDNMVELGMALQI